MRFLTCFHSQALSPVEFHTQVNKENDILRSFTPLLLHEVVTPLIIMHLPDGKSRIPRRPVKLRIRTDIWHAMRDDTP